MTRTLPLSNLQRELFVGLVLPGDTVMTTTSPSRDENDSPNSNGRLLAWPYKSLWKILQEFSKSSPIHINNQTREEKAGVKPNERLEAATDGVRPSIFPDRSGDAIKWVTTTIRFGSRDRGAI